MDFEFLLLSCNKEPFSRHQKKALRITYVENEDRRRISLFVGVVTKPPRFQALCWSRHETYWLPTLVLSPWRDGMETEGVPIGLGKAQV